MLIGQLHLKFKQTRMHSSGMRTARLLTVSQHALGRGWSVYPSMQGDKGCLPGGCLPGWMSTQWGVCPKGVCGRHPPPVDRQTPVKT